MTIVLWATKIIYYRILSAYWGETCNIDGRCTINCVTTLKDSNLKNTETLSVCTINPT